MGSQMEFMQFSLYHSVVAKSIMIYAERIAKYSGRGMRRHGDGGTTSI
jgi:hypothetical protein